MNRVIIKGNMTRDPELKEAGDSFLAEFGVAVNEAIVNHFGKGQPILVEGEFRTDRWEKDGAKKSKSYVHVRDFEFCSKKSE